jgi:hypothetical protein
MSASRESAYRLREKGAFYGTLKPIMRGDRHVGNAGNRQ